MTKDELITKQQLEIEELKITLSSYKKDEDRMIENLFFIEDIESVCKSTLDTLLFECSNELPLKAIEAIDELKSAIDKVKT